MAAARTSRAGVQTRRDLRIEFTGCSFERFVGCPSGGESREPGITYARIGADLLISGHFQQLEACFFVIEAHFR